MKEFMENLAIVDFDRYRWLLSIALAGFYGVLVLIGSLAYIRRKKETRWKD